MCADAREDSPPFSLSEAIEAGLRATDAEAFRRTSFYRVYGDALEGWLRVVRAGSPSREPDACDPDRLRIVHWNIQQGKRWDRLLAAIDEDSRLREADLWTLNEAEIGMARSGNRHVARELGERLGLHWIFAANYFEFTKGPGEDARAPGENEVGLHGSAIFSRWPLIDARTADLPDIFDYFRLPVEKRTGARRVLWATVQHPRGPFRLATAHLEVRNTPASRALQMEAALAALPDGPIWFAGDWNTHTFARGSFARTVREFVRLQGSAREIDRQLLAPWEREPLLRRVEEAGLDFRTWSDGSATAREILSGVEELGILPSPARRLLSRLFRLNGRVLRMRLDWIAARGPWMPAQQSAPVWTGTGAGPEGLDASDHAPIGTVAEWR